MSSRYRRGKVYWLAYYQNGKLKRESLKTRDLATAKGLQADFDQAQNQGLTVMPNQNNLVQPVFESYDRFKAGQRNEEYHQAVIARIRAYIVKENIRTFRQITQESLQVYLNGISKFSPNTRNHIIRDVQEFVRYAKNRNIIPKNNLEGFQRINEGKKLLPFLSKESLDILLKEAANPNHYVDGIPTFYPLLLTAAYTGLRRGELFTLEWKNIDFKEDLIRIINKPNFRVKTGRERIIPIPPPLKKELLKLKRQSSRERCFDITNWQRLLRRILRAAKLKQRGIGFHILRHTFMTHFIRDKKDIKAAQEIAGHSSIKTTMIYTHSDKAHLKELVANFSLKPK